MILIKPKESVLFFLSRTIVNAERCLKFGLKAVHQADEDAATL